MNAKGKNYYVPEDAAITITECGVNIDQLNEVICNLSFDVHPDTVINYSITAIPAKKPQLDSGNRTFN